MLDVIGVSITLEYTAKMLYENSIGRVFSWFSNGTPSDEEKVIAQAQRAYSDFIYDVAWYEFDFMPWVSKVWKTSNTADSNWLRKFERKLFFTLEFTFKAGYAKLIEWAAKSSYEAPVTEIYLMVTSPDSLRTTPGVTVLHEEREKKIISITRWGVFTKTVLDVADKDISIGEVGGNDEIIVSVLMTKDRNHDFTVGEILYESRVVTNPNRSRKVYLLTVDKLLPFVKEGKQNGVEIEHIYDY
jgi:hypothetical protein